MSDLEAKIKDHLSSVSEKLSRGGYFSRGDAFNFTASIDLFCGERAVEEEKAAINQLLGSRATVDFIVISDWDKLSARINECLNWEGLDENSQPNRQYQLSTQFIDDLTEALSLLKELFTDATGFWEFGLSDGHPFYPVYWDFAFLVKRPNRNYVFIGSSSD